MLYYNPSSICLHRGCDKVGTYSAFDYLPNGSRYETVACEAHRHPSAYKLGRKLR